MKIIVDKMVMFVKILMTFKGFSNLFVLKTILHLPHGQKIHEEKVYNRSTKR